MRDYLSRMEGEVIEAFRVSHADRPAAAILPPAWPTSTHRKMFARLARKRAFVATGGGRYYLDEAALAASLRRRNRGLMLYCAALVAVVILLLVLLS